MPPKLGINTGLMSHVAQDRLYFLFCITGQGHYIYTEASAKSISDKARLDGAKARAPADGACISFWYYMYGRDMGSLMVYTSETNGVLGPVQFSQSGDTRKNEWLEGKVNVAPDSEFQVSHGI